MMADANPRHDVPEPVKLDNFPKYIRRQSLTRFCARYELFKLQRDVKGSIVECGVHHGGGLMAWAKLSAGLKRAQMRLMASAAGVTQMGTKIAMIGGGAMAPLLASVKHFASAGDKLDKMANRTGMTVEALSELAFAAEQSGAGIDIFEKAVAGMQRSIRDAGRGLSTKTEALKDVGLSYKALAGLSPEDQFSLVAEAIGRIPDATKGMDAQSAVHLFIVLAIIIANILYIRLGRQEQRPEVIS